MRISVDWLKNYIDLDLSIPQLIQTLDNIGLLVDDKEEVKGDVILEVETYANRPDTTGHLGVARELSAVLGIPLKEQNWPLTEIEEKTADSIDIQIWEEELCPRYCGVLIRSIEVGPSPKWLREKIEAMGLNPVNNVVDVSNYILFSTAHPIHAFDLAKLAGGKIIIRKAQKGESLMSLEGKNIQLSPENLVIADEKKPVALAGVIGGEETAVSETTNDILIESACFDPVSIRKTSKEVGVQTDASFRFERGADVSFPPQAALRAASLLSQMGGRVTQGIVDVYPNPTKNKTVVLRDHRIAELLGVEIDTDFVVKTLASLGFQVENQQQGIWQIKVPLFRVDIEREADLIEEVARFYGYDKIPSQIPPFTAFEPEKDQKRRTINKLRHLLFHHGFDEVVNFSFSDPEKETVLNSKRKEIEIRNPISSKAAILRTTLIGGLLENIVWNRNRGAEGVHIFEVGNIYFWGDEKHREELTLTLVTTGSVGATHLQKKDEGTDFFYLKGACEALMNHLRYEPFTFEKGSHPCFEQDSSLALQFKGKKIGCLGALKREILDAYSLKDGVWAAELNLDALFEKQPRSFQYTSVIKYPSVYRDVAFIADRSVTYQEIKEAVEKLSISHLENFDLHDRFEGAPIPKGKIGLSLRFIFRNPKRTLLAEEVDSMIQKVTKTLSASFGFQLREGGKIDK